MSNSLSVLIQSRSPVAHSPQVLLGEQCTAASAVMNSEMPGTLAISRESLRAINLFLPVFTGARDCCGVKGHRTVSSPVAGMSSF